MPWLLELTEDLCHAIGPAIQIQVTGWGLLNTSLRLRGGSVVAALAAIALPAGGLRGFGGIRSIKSLS